MKRACEGTHLQRLSAFMEQRSGGIPKEFPEDVPIYPGLMCVAPSKDKGRVSIMALSGENPEQVIAYYAAKLLEHGWTGIAPEEDSESTVAMNYGKEGRILTVGISGGCGKGSVVSLQHFEPDAFPGSCDEDMQPGSPDACAILARTYEVYSQCRTYRDTGVVKRVTFTEDIGNWSEEQPFFTAFLRPHRFRFEYRDRFVMSCHWHRHIAYSDESGTRVWGDYCRSEPEKSLDLILAGFGGVSGGSACTIPPLLFNTGECAPRFGLSDLELLPDAYLNGVLCYRIDGKCFGDDVQSLWIDKETLLLRRLDWAHEFPDFRAEHSTIYNPEVNRDIADRDLEFRPPGAWSLALGQVMDMIYRPLLRLWWRVNGLTVIVLLYLGLLKTKGAPPKVRNI